MTANIYDIFDKATRDISAFAVMDKFGCLVAKVIIKFPRDGAGRLTAYTHYLGTRMTRGTASGYGYDKRSPAVCEGFAKAAKENPDNELLERFAKAVSSRDGYYWNDNLREAGFIVHDII